MRLPELQKAFTRGVLDGRAVPVRGGGRLSPKAALAVYRDGYFARLTEALGETYEGTWSVLGDEGFFAACRDYIVKNKSSFYNLSDYGRDFGRSLKSREFPFLGELADFEWSFKNLFHEKQHGHADLTKAAPESALAFGKAVVLRRHKFSVYSVWKKRKSRAALPRSAWDKPEQLLLYKRNGDIFVKTVPTEEFRVLERLSNNSSLAAALFAIKLDPRRASELFSMISEAGIVERIDPKGESK